MKKMARALPVLALLAAVALTLTVGKNTQRPSSSSSVQPEPYHVEKVFESSEFKAVWVPYMDLDQSGEDEQHFGKFKEKFDSIIKNAREAGMNTVMVHVRPFADSFYRSQYLPWSHLLTGTQGQDPGYDAMAYMVQAAHNAGLSFHAWINPLRIRSNSTPQTLASSNPHSIWRNDGDIANDRWTVELENGIYFNPCYEQVRTLIIDGVKEMVAKYDVDAVHMDDYFYPTQDENFDQQEYDTYRASVKAGEPLSLSNWRMEQINLLVSGLYSAVKETKSSALFGISPQGNLENCQNMCADIETWCSQPGYIDYICPQLYFHFDNPVKPFTRTAQEWKTLVTYPQVRLYAGLALYKANDPEADNGVWAGQGDIIRKQLETLEQQGYEGFALYSYDYLFAQQTSAEMQEIKQCLGAVQKQTVSDNLQTVPDTSVTAQR